MLRYPILQDLRFHIFRRSIPIYSSLHTYTHNINKHVHNACHLRRYLTGPIPLLTTISQPRPQSLIHFQRAGHHSGTNVPVPIPPSSHRSVSASPQKLSPLRLTRPSLRIISTPSRLLTTSPLLSARSILHVRNPSSSHCHALAPLRILPLHLFTKHHQS
jgi:hypothetical protein